MSCYVDTLNSQIHCLQDENRTLKYRLEDIERSYSEEKAVERCLDQENHLLKHNLSTATRLNQSLEFEKNKVISDTEYELNQALEKIKQLELEIENTEQEKEELNKNLVEAEQSSKMVEYNLKDSQEIITRIQDDKLRLTQRIEKLTANERILVLEIQRLKRKGGQTKDSNSQIEQYMRGIEEDRDYWKGEAELLRMMNSRNGFKSTTSNNQKMSDKSKSSKKSPSKDKRVKELEKEKEDLKQQLDSMRQEKNGTAASLRGRSPSPSIRNRPSSKAESPLGDTQYYKEKISELMNEKQQLEEKLNTMRKQLSPARMRSQSPSYRNKSPSRASSKKNTDEDVVQLRRERDDLRNLLNKLEKRVTEIQSNVCLLTQEKDRYLTMYEEARKEIHHLHHDLLSTQEDGGRASQETKKLLGRLEADRESVQCELARVQNERDGLLERYKTTIDTANNDKFLLEKKIEDLTNALQDARCEKRDMTERMESLRCRIIDLEGEVKSLEVGTHENMKQIESEKSSSNQLKQKLHQSENHLDSAEKQIVQLRNQLNHSEDTSYMKDQKLAKLTEDLRLQRDEYARLRNEANRLDGDKDQLKSTLSEASQRIHQLEADLQSAEDELAETKDQLSAAEQQLGRLSENLGCRDKENWQMKKRAENMCCQLDEQQRKINILSRDNDRLSEEIDQLKQLRKNLESDLQETIDEREDLRVQTQNYLGEVKAAEELLAQREEDQKELLGQYQRMSEDAGEYKVRLETTQRELSSIKTELVDREADLEEAKAQIDLLQKEATDSRIIRRDLETKINHLNHLVCQNKEQVKLIQHERDDLMEDLSALRDLCGRLEKAKEELEQDNDSRALDIEQLQAQIDDAERELEELREELDGEKDKYKNLESILQASRSQEQATVAEVQEKSAELSQLTDKLQMSQEKLDQHERDLQRMKTRVNDLERDNERLQRNLSNERFEKDRALSELRIQSLSPSYKPSFLSNGTNGAHRSSSPCRGCSP